MKLSLFSKRFKTFATPTDVFLVVFHSLIGFLSRAEKALALASRPLIPTNQYIDHTWHQRMKELSYLLLVDVKWKTAHFYRNPGRRVLVLVVQIVVALFGHWRSIVVIAVLVVDVAAVVVV